MIFPQWFGEKQGGEVCSVHLVQRKGALHHIESLTEASQHKV